MKSTKTRNQTTRHTQLTSYHHYLWGVWLVSLLQNNHYYKAIIIKNERNLFPSTINNENKMKIKHKPPPSSTSCSFTYSCTQNKNVGFFIEWLVGCHLNLQNTKNLGWFFGIVCYENLDTCRFMCFTNGENHTFFDRWLYLSDVI